VMSTPFPADAVASTAPLCAVSSTTAFPSAQAANRKCDRSSYAMPREPLHWFGHLATMLRDLMSITTLVPDHKCVYARPPPPSITSDSGPPGTLMKLTCANRGEMLKISICSESGCVTHNSCVGPT